MNISAASGLLPCEAGGRRRHGARLVHLLLVRSSSVVSSEEHTDAAVGKCALRKRATSAFSDTQEINLTE